MANTKSSTQSPLRLTQRCCINLFVVCITGIFFGPVYAEDWPTDPKEFEKKLNSIETPTPELLAEAYEHIAAQVGPLLSKGRADPDNLTPAENRILGEWIPIRIKLGVQLQALDDIRRQNKPPPDLSPGVVFNPKFSEHAIGLVDKHLCLTVGIHEYIRATKRRRDDTSKPGS